MPSGTVKFFNAKKGFGFITPDEGDKEIFLPANSIAPADLSKLNVGQRVSFETTPSNKGPKAVKLTLLATPQQRTVAKQPLPQSSKPDQRPQFTIYHDPDNEESCEALTALRAAGHDPLVIDYFETPLTQVQLKALSALLRDGDQSLVRRYDPMFRELQLDDRFIGENEFWGAIAENPSLINGPVIETATKARVCPSKQAVKSFLASLSSTGTPMPEKPKVLSERLLRLIRGEVPTRSPAEAKAPDSIEEKPANKVPAETKVPHTKKSKSVKLAKAKPKAILLKQPKSAPKPKTKNASPKKPARKK